MKEEVIKILMSRDDMTHEEAEELVNDTIAEIEDNAYEGADEILMSNLGLEPDYIIYLF